MKKKISYTNEPMGKPKVIQDFLPVPEDLVLKEDCVKVTMLVSKKSIEFFKRQAVRHKIPTKR